MPTTRKTAQVTKVKAPATADWKRSQVRKVGARGERRRQRAGPAKQRVRTRTRKRHVRCRKMKLWTWIIPAPWTMRARQAVCAGRDARAECKQTARPRRALPSHLYQRNQEADHVNQCRHLHQLTRSLQQRGLQSLVPLRRRSEAGRASRSFPRSPKLLVQTLVQLNLLCFPQLQQPHLSQWHNLLLH